MVDAVIIGGGPAGVSAGTVLQRNRYTYFSKGKLCADVLTVKFIKLIQHIYQI